MDINPVLVKDKRINQITDSCDYAVYSGASQNTFQQFPATTQSASNISFNVQVPSENIVVDRNVFISSTVNFTLTLTGYAGTYGFNLGLNESLQSFPLNKLFSTSSCTLNNTNVSVNTQDIIDALLKQIPQDKLQKYQGMTPTLLDGAYKNYTDSTNNTNNPLGSYQNASLNNLFVPRGVHQIIVNKAWRVPSSGSPTTTDPFAATNAGDTVYVNCSVNLTEPLMCLSPFLFGDDNTYNSQGLVGINSMNIVLNVDSSCKRFWSSNSSPYLTVSLGNVANSAVGAVAKSAFENTNLLLNFLSTQPTDLVKAKNVVAYSDYPRYITTNLATLGADGSSNTYSSQNIQMNQIPDKLFIFVRKPMSSQTVYDSATFLPIKSISLNFSNASGLLSSASTQDLFKMSIENGLQSNWYEWLGYSNRYDSGTGKLGVKTRTGGSVLVINPAKDLSLPSYLTNGSLGAFSLQFNITVENNGTTQYQPEIVVICQNSGVFVTQSGSSSIFTGVLSKQMVLDTVSNQEAFDSAEYDRLVGGMKMSSALKAVPRPMKRVAGIMSAGVRSAGVRKLDAMSM